MQLVEKVTDQRLELFIGAGNEDANILCIGLASSNIQLYRRYGEIWKEEKVFKTWGQPVALSVLQEGEQIGVIMSL